MRNVLKRIMQRLRRTILVRRAQAVDTSLPRPRTAVEDAKEFLTQLLAGGPVQAQQVLRDAEQAGITLRTLRRAKAELGVRSRMLGKLWAWELARPHAVPASGPAQMQKFLTPNEVAELLHVHPQTVYKWIRKGRIRAVRFASRWTIPQSAIVGGTAYTPAIGRALRIRRIDRHDTRRPVHVAARITAPHDLPVDPQAGKPAALRSSARYAVAEIVDAITALLAGHDWLTQRQIRDMLGGNVAAMSVKWALNYLVQRAIVERDPPEKKQGATYKYRLASRNGGPELTTPKGGAEEVKSGDPEPGNFTSPLGEAVEVKSGNLETGNFMSPMHIKSGEC